MIVEFVDTNVLVYAYHSGAAGKQDVALKLIERLWNSATGAVSIQVLTEFYSTATQKLGISAETAEQIIDELGTWIVHSPIHVDLLNAIRLQRRHRLSWWDALLLNSALKLDCSILWSEDFADGRKFGSVTVRNPFR
jgi:predicted nucleic acid-binding protein